MITIVQVLSALKKIARCAKKGDNEGAHGAEDKLFEDVLRTIAGQSYAPGETAVLLAANALRAKRIEFARWTS